MSGFAVAVFLISGTGIAYELLFTRIFAIAQWYHFAYMIISIAMLGFGVGGTVLSMTAHRLRGKEQAIFRFTAFLLPISIAGCYALSQTIPFDTFSLINQPRQWLYLFLLYCVLAFPFFLVSVCLTLSFFIYSSRIGFIYFLNMTGSGIGAVYLTAGLYLLSPQHLVYLLVIIAVIAFTAVIPTMREHRRLALATVPAILGITLFFTAVPINVSQYKGLSYTLDYPDANIVTRKHSPISELTVVESDMIRETPGQISHYAGKEGSRLPEQKAVFFDAGAMSVINKFDNNLEKFRFLDQVTAALPYHLGDPDNVYIGGAGGGTDVLMALFHDARQITACEVEPTVFQLMNHDLKDFCGGLYQRASVEPVVGDVRGWLRRNPSRRFNLIQMTLLDSFNASSAGVHALSESYLYTVEAVQSYIEHLSPDGVLAITRWLQTPPRDAVKMFATLVEGAEAAGIEEPEKHFVWIRSWNTATLVFLQKPLTQQQIASAKDFTLDRGFDLCYYPGISAQEVNKHMVLTEPVYFRAAKAILSKDREAFYNNYLYSVRPATDDKPYFFRFFKWSTLPELLKQMGKQWVPFVEWGYLALIATILQGIIASLFLILLPLIVFRRIPKENTKPRLLAVVAYFGLLGLAFMFLEIAFIQKLMLFLTYPVYAVAVVLTSFMFFSGIGSYAADRLKNRALPTLVVTVAAVTVLAALHIVYAETVFELADTWHEALRIAVSIFMLAPLAFFMGIPFPLALQKLVQSRPVLVPWAWGINGFLSVLGATLATFTAVHLGFAMLVLFAVVCYLLVLAVFTRQY
ncbi:MAG: SAM-dependent methyltransferase [Lentisphaeria bacterium]